MLAYSSFATRSGRLPGSAGDRETRQGQLQRRPVGGPLRARALAVRPDHHVPAEGTAGGLEGDPRSGGEAGGRPNPQAAELLKQARSLAFTPIVSSSLAGQADFLKVFASNKKEVAGPKQITGLEESWNRKARENYAKAVEHRAEAGHWQVDAWRRLSTPMRRAHRRRERLPGAWALRGDRSSSWERFRLPARAAAEQYVAPGRYVWVMTIFSFRPKPKKKKTFFSFFLSFWLSILLALNLNL